MSTNVSVGRPREAILVITDAPTDIEFGIDTMTYQTGPKFKGVSMLPPGIHFVYHSTGLASRQGFFIEAGNDELAVRAWDTANEEILPSHNLSEDSLKELRTAIDRGELNNNLGPYPFQQHHIWLNISCFITLDVLHRADCEPNTLVFPGDETSLDEIPLKKMKTSTYNSALKPYFPGIARVARFVDIKSVEVEMVEATQQSPEKGKLITVMMMDKSRLLNKLINDSYGGSYQNLLGELQLSFLLFILLYSYPGLNHWKQLINAISNSEIFLKDNPAFTSAFLKIFYCQLNFCPNDFFESEISKDNFLRPIISSLFLSLSGGITNQSVMEHKRRLLNFLRKKFDLFDDVDEDEKWDEFDTEFGVDLSAEKLYSLVDEDKPIHVSESEIFASKRRLNAGSDVHNDFGIDPGAFVDVTMLNSVQQMNVQDRKPISSNSSNKWKEINALLDTKQPTNIATIGSDMTYEPSAPEVSIDVQKEITPMTETEIEIGLYSWRYPLLYDDMVAKNGAEDMTMTAMRIFDEIVRNNTISIEEAVKSSGLMSEAVRFIEDEVSKRTKVN